MKDSYKKRLLKVGSYSMAVALPSPYCKFLRIDTNTLLKSEIADKCLIIKKADKLDKDIKCPYITGKYTLAYTIVEELRTQLEWQPEQWIEITACDNAIIVKELVLSINDECRLAGI